MKNNHPYLTILTPTYNRAKLLKKCYESLKNQTEQEFQWLIIDDGSTDDTKEVVESYISESPQMDISYFKKENGGKHTALNYSHSYIKGDYVLILDSDDVLTEDAVENVYKEWQLFNQQKEIGIVIFLKGSSVNSPNAYVKDQRIPVDIMSYQRICVRSRDCCEVIRTEILKEYPFPVFENEKFISEGALWNRVSFTYQCVYVNKVIYLCEYLEGGLTKSGRYMRVRNPLGGMYTSQLRMNKKNNIKERVKSGLLYVCYGFFAKKKINQILFEEKVNIILKCICLIPGKVLHVIWSNKYFSNK